MQTETNAFGHDKIERYGWIVTSGVGRFETINKRLLHVNTDIYQRDHTKPKVLEMASKWSWISCGALTVAERGGVYWVVDGQHRKLAADRRSDIKELPCMVFSVAAVADEARAFLATNTNRKPVTALGKFKAMVAAGHPGAISVNRIVASAGLRLATASKEISDFKAVALALDLVERDEDAFSDVMHMAAEMARQDKGPLHKRFLAGLFYLHTNLPDGFNDPKLRKRVFQVGMNALVDGADKAAAYYAKGGAKVYADGMLQVINSRLQHRFALAA